MNKLDWFKFSPREWTMGSISRMPLTVQAEYIRFCCTYWNDDCNVSEARARVELSKKTYLRLSQSGLLVIEGGQVRIHFLDAQRRDIDVLRENARKAGIASAQARAQRKANARSTPAQQNSTEKDKEKENVYRSFAHLSITHAEYKKLIDIWSEDNVNHVLDSIENYKNIGHYKSLYLTARTWLKDKPKRTEESNHDALVEHVQKQIRK